MAKQGRASKEKVRAAFDFETWGWTPEEGEGQVRVNALCCAFVVPCANEEGAQEILTPYYLEDRTHQVGTRQARTGEETVDRALRFMWSFADVDEWWAHFAHAFDTLHLLGAAYRLGWQVKAAVAGQGPISVDLKPSGETRWLCIRDLFRVLPAKLARIAEDFDLPSQKLFTKADYSGDMRDLPRERLRAGCVTDCLLVLEALDVVGAMLESFGGELRTTSSSSAFTVLKASCKARHVRLPPMDHSRACKARPKDTPCACYHAANIQARAGYYGARVEVFHHASGHELKEYDVSSSYPWSMTQVLPVRWAGNVTGQRAQKAFESGVHGIYEASVHVPRSMALPPLPYKLDEGGLYFPTGEWRAHFPQVELAYAASLGCRVKIHAGITYESGQPFESYVAQLYETKRTADGALREFIKLLLNGSYGKFAERPERERLFFIPDELEALHLQWEEPNIRPLAPDIDPRFLAQESLRYARHAHYAIGAYITAHSRILIHQEMRRAVDLTYVDTDSLHCASWPGEAGDALGQLMLKLGGFWGRYYAPKLYSLHDGSGAYLSDAKGRLRVACKGFQKGSVADFESILDSARTFYALLAAGVPKMLAKEGAQGAGQSIVRTRLLRSQMAPGATMAEVLRLRVKKSWSGLSKKRRPFKDGSTLPWSVAELDAGKHWSAVCPLLGV